MTEVPWGAIAQVIGALLLFGGGYLTVKHNSKQGSYDQVQEDLKETRADNRRKDNTIRARDRTIRIQGDYIETLRDQLRQAKVVPAAYPKELIGSEPSGEVD